MSDDGTSGGKMGFSPAGMGIHNCQFDFGGIPSSTLLGFSRSSTAGKGGRGSMVSQAADTPL